MHMNVTCFNLNVLLTGIVPEKFTRAETGSIAIGVKSVVKLFEFLD